MSNGMTLGKMLSVLESQFYHLHNGIKHTSLSSCYCSRSVNTVLGTQEIPQEMVVAAVLG